jgi:outer membrane protein assembly factor BamB
LTWTHEGLEETSTFIGSSSPVVSKGIVIVTYSSGEIYAINLSNGIVIWSENLSKLVQKKSLENISDIRGNAVIQNDVVYVVSHNGRMVAMNLNNGKKLWESNIGGIQTPWVVSKFIYSLSKNNELIVKYIKETNPDFILDFHFFAIPSTVFEQLFAVIKYDP